MQMYHPKTTASALGGALSVIVMAELTRRGIPFDATEGSALTLIVGYLCGYFAPDSDTTQEQLDIAAGKVPNPGNGKIPSPNPEVEGLRAKPPAPTPATTPAPAVPTALAPATTGTMATS